MKHKKRKDKRSRNLNAAVTPHDSAQSEHAFATVADVVPALVANSAPHAPPAAAGDDVAGCVSENFLTPPARKSGGVPALGKRLVAARETRGWNRADVASRLHLPLHVVDTIEADDYEKIGHGIYLRGYLNKYARLVDVPSSAVDDVMRVCDNTPQLVASGRISHSRYLFERYSGAALYVVLTGVIFVPLIMFAMNMGGDVGSRLLPLDAPGATNPAAAAKADSSLVSMPLDGSATAQISPPPTETKDAAAPAPKQSDAPLLASFAPIASPSHAQTTEPDGAQSLRLSLAEASWVEIVDADGKRLEYGILPAGSVRSYASDKPLDVRIGNTIGARVEVNGTTQDIAPFNHGNVAHFKLFASGKTISRTDS